MNVFRQISLQPNKEIARIKNELNLTDEENVIYDMMMRNKSSQEIADNINVSVRTVFRRLDNIKEKLNNL